jgi:hypothetical protein
MVAAVQVPWHVPEMEPGTSRADIKHRLALLKIVLADRWATSKQIAEAIGIGYKNYNSVEKSGALSTQIALALVQHVPGLTLDWLWRGREEGLSVDLARKLDQAKRGVPVTRNRVRP